MVILCQSVSQSTTPVLTRGGFNPPKRKSRQKQTHANKHESWDSQKQTDESLNNQSKVVHEYLFIVETKNTPKANHAKQTDEMVQSKHRQMGNFIYGRRIHPGMPSISDTSFPSGCPPTATYQQRPPSTSSGTSSQWNHPR